MPYYDADPSSVPSLRARLPRDRIDWIDERIPRRFVDRSDAMRRLIEIGIENFPDDAPKSEEVSR